MSDFKRYLKGGDLRSIGDVDKIISMIKDQKSFDDLVNYISSSDRLMTMRAADALEKISLDHPEYLHKHKDQLINLIEKAQEKELKWHLALMITRVPLKDQEVVIIWPFLKSWVLDRKESRIVRVNALEAMHNISKCKTDLQQELHGIISQLLLENVPSLNARIKKLKLAMN